MDTVSLREASRLLGSSPPRVRRALVRIGRSPRPKGRGRALEISGADLDALRGELGAVTRDTGFTRTEMMVLAALERSPRGLVGARAVARRSAVAPTTASRVLARLEWRGVVRRDREMEAAGRAREVEVWSVVTTHPDVRRAWPRLAATRPPHRPPAEPAARVPARLSHLFWTGDVGRIRLPQHAAFVARRIRDSGDPEALAWGAANLPTGAWSGAEGPPARRERV